jgi:hypothetical protein
MSIQFKNLNVTSLAPTDKITKGKYKDCRVCDVASDFVYLTWADKAGVLPLNAESKALVEKFRKQYDDEVHYQQEIKPYEDDPNFDDVPY